MYDADKIAWLIYMELSFLKLSQIEYYQGFGEKNAKIRNVRQVDKRTAVGYPDRGLVQHGVCQNGGRRK